MIKLIAALYLKLVSICMGINSLATGVYLQVLPPEIKKEPLVSEAVQLAFLNMLGLVGVAFFTNWKSNKIKNEVVAVKSEVVTVKDEVVAVKTNVDGVHKEVEDLKVNTDGKLSELMNANKALSEQLGIQKGIEQSKVAHDAQSEKDKEAHIALGKVAAQEEAKAAQPNSLLPNQAEPIKVVLSHEEPVKVQIDQPESNPTPVVVIEKPKKEPDK